jgi:SAM-dependent methyltransferase
LRGRRRRGASPADVGALVTHHLEAGEPTGWFEPLYAAAGHDPDGVPWADGGPHPYLTDWLDDPVATPPGPRALVVGCGLGDDAAELDGRGFEVTAVDVAPSAIRWARRRHRRRDITWRVADVLEPPDDLLGAFDLVVEIRTVQSLPGVVRDAAMDAIARLVAPGGVLLVVTLVARDEATARAHVGPPWAQAPSELTVYTGPGLLRLALEHPDPDEAGLMEIRLTLQRPLDAPPDAIGGAGGLPIAP